MPAYEGSSRLTSANGLNRPAPPCASSHCQRWHHLAKHRCISMTCQACTYCWPFSCGKGMTNTATPRMPHWGVLGRTLWPAGGSFRGIFRKSQLLVLKIRIAGMQAKCKMLLAGEKRSGSPPPKKPPKKQQQQNKTQKNTHMLCACQKQGCEADTPCPSPNTVSFLTVKLDIVLNCIHTWQHVECAGHAKHLLQLPAGQRQVCSYPSL